MHLRHRSLWEQVRGESGAFDLRDLSPGSAWPTGLGDLWRHLCSDIERGQWGWPELKTSLKTGLVCRGREQAPGDKCDEKQLIH